MNLLDVFVNINHLELTLRAIGYSPNRHFSRLVDVINNPNASPRDVIAASRELRTIISEAQPKSKITALTRDSHGNEFTLTQTQPAADLIAQLGAIRDRNSSSVSIARVVPPLRTILDAQPTIHAHKPDPVPDDLSPGIPDGTQEPSG